MEEIWKIIEGYENYSISNLGRIKKGDIKVINENREVSYKPVLLNPSTNAHGYKKVSIRDNEGNRKTHLIHRLVAIAFIPNPNNYKIINHKNEIKKDNRVDNLEWCTTNYNIAYSKTDDKSNIIECQGVDQYNLKGEFIRHWDLIREAARQITPVHGSVNATKCSIIRCCKGVEKTCRGYIWRYS